jgi:hypothetical protein
VTADVDQEPTMTDFSDWTDSRPVADIAFGIESPEAARAADVAWLRAVLAKMGVETGEDLRRLGCTTLSPHCSIEELQRVRLLMGGSGVGLTCFVPPSRYCLVHNTVGGLQDNQKVLGAEYVDAISRELEPHELEGIARVEHVRNMAEATDRTRLDVLKGKVPAVNGADPLPAVFSSPSPAVALWKCDIHPQTEWACRYCVAQAVVEFELLPSLLLFDGDELLEPVTGAEVAARVGELDKQGGDRVAIFVKAARYTRRLAREE